MFDALKKSFGDSEPVLTVLIPVYTFRNKFIAHQDGESVSKEIATQQMPQWIQLLVLLYRGRGILTTQAAGA